MKKPTSERRMRPLPASYRMTPETGGHVKKCYNYDNAIWSGHHRLAERDAVLCKNVECYQCSPNRRKRSSRM
jgi:hypothetical protein